MSKHVGAVRAKDAKMLPVGAFVEGELYLSWMHFFQAHSFLLFFILLFFYLLLLLFKSQSGDTTLAWWPVVIVLPTNIFTKMRRLARDETPFPLAMQPRVTALAWWPANGNVILLDTHGPNRLARDETPYPLVRLCFIIFPGPSCFLLRSLLLLSQESLGEASRGFILRLLSFTSLLLPSGPLAPSSHEVRCRPENRSTQCPDKGNGISEW